MGQSIYVEKNAANTPDTNPNELAAPVAYHFNRETGELSPMGSWADHMDIVTLSGTRTIASMSMHGNPTEGDAMALVAKLWPQQPVKGVSERSQTTDGEGFPVTFFKFTV